MSPIIVVVGIIVVIVLIVAMVFLAREPKTEADIEGRLNTFQEFGEDAIVDLSEDPDANKKVLTDWVNQQVEKSSFGDKMQKSLLQADIKFKSGEYIALMFILVILLGGIGFLFVGDTIAAKAFSGFLGAIMGIALPMIYLNSQKGTRLKHFNQQLPDMLNLMVNGLQAGYSTMQALESVAKEMPAPISEEFHRVVQEMQLGISMEKALANLYRRIPSADLDFIITAINVQREVGGPLANILDTISYTIRERIKIKGEIRVLVSTVTTSAKILSGVPFAVFGILWLVSQDYMGEYFKNMTCGMTALGVGFFLIVLGYLAMMKMADIEV